MATTRVWDVQYVAGNPSMFKKVTTAADGPYRRSEALEVGKSIAEKCSGWRVWVVHVETGKRIFESPVEVEYKRKAV